MHSASQLVTSNKKLQQLVTSNKLTSLDIKERALFIAEGMTSIEEPNNMTAWYCKAFRTIGEGKYTAIARSARDGRNPSALFGWLLKQEMDKKT